MTIRSIQKGLVLTSLLLIFGCGGTAPDQTIADASDSTQSAESDTVSVPSAEDDTAPHDAGHAANSDIATDAEQRVSCGGKTCEPGQSCIEYTGYAGNQLYTCGIPCIHDQPNDGCPSDMHCQVIPDGPTQCVK